MEAFLDQIATPKVSDIEPLCLAYLMTAMTRFNMHDFFLHPKKIKPITGQIQLCSIDSDWRYPSSEMQYIADQFQKAGVNATHQVLKSTLGHGAFIYDFDCCQKTIKDFMHSIHPA